jgi:hypothetical protein
MAEIETTKTTSKRKRISRVERSRRIWEQVETAVRDLAIRRGWPHETFEDLDQAVRRLDEEHLGEERHYWRGLHACLLIKDNVEYDFMESWEVKSWQPMAEKYINELQSLQ